MTHRTRKILIGLGKVLVTVVVLGLWAYSILVLGLALKPLQ